MWAVTNYNVYGCLGKRRLKLIDGDATWFRWDGLSTFRKTETSGDAAHAGRTRGNMIAEYDGGAVQTDWDPGNLEMSYIPGLAQVPGTNPATGAYASFASDHPENSAPPNSWPGRCGLPSLRGKRTERVGTVRGVYNQSKALTTAMDYSPYGEPDAWRGDVPATTYTGHYWDSESSMYFAPYRYYMPGAGRWLTRDPVGMVDGENFYSYVEGNPVRELDPYGLFKISGDCAGNDAAIKQQVQDACNNLDQWITDPELKKCVKKRCAKGKIECHKCDKDCPGLGWNTYFGPFRSKRIHICGDHAGASNQYDDTAIHEWLHSCNYHKQDSGDKKPYGDGV